MTEKMHKNRALMIAFHFPPQAASSGIQRTLSFSRHLGAHDWEPMVLSANGIAYEQKNDSQLRDLPSGLLVKRAFAIDSKRHLGIKGRYPEFIALPDRWISWWLPGVLGGLSLVRQHKPAVIWSTFPLATAHLIGLTLKRLTRLPWVADFRDPMLQENFPTSSLQRKAYQWIEHQAIHKCDIAVFTTYSALDSYKRRFPENLHEKFTVIENGYDDDQFNIIVNNAPRETAAINRRVTLLHSGVLYTAGRDPSAFFEAIATLKASGEASATSLRVILRAPGEIPYFTALVNKHGIEDIVEVAPPIPYREALNEMLAVDGLLVFQGTPFNTQIPAKIYEYFRARKPIFGLVDPAGETARVLNAAGFHNLAPMTSAPEIAVELKNLIDKMGDGSAYIATDEIIASASRKNRANELARLFKRVSTP